MEYPAYGRPSSVMPPPAAPEGKKKLIIFFLVFIILLLVAAAVGVVYMRRSRGVVAEIVPVVVTSVPTLAPSPTAPPPDASKLYQNTELGISFWYPAEWTEHQGVSSLIAWFSEGNGSLSEKLQARWVPGATDPLVVAEQAIANNNCGGDGVSGDRVLSHGPTWAMYVLGCGISSEHYLDAVKVPTGILVLDYHDDWEETADVAEKIKVLEAVGKSVTSTAPVPQNPAQ